MAGPAALVRAGRLRVFMAKTDAGQGPEATGPGRAVFSRGRFCAIRPDLNRATGSKP